MRPTKFTRPAPWLFGPAHDLHGQHSLPLGFPDDTGGAVAATPSTGATLASEGNATTIETRDIQGQNHPRSVKPETRDQYLSFVKTLTRQFLRQASQPTEQAVRPIDLVEFLISRAPSLRPKTCTAYRAGLLYWINSLPESEDTHHARLILQVGMPKHGYKGTRPKQTATLYSRKSQRPRTFPQRRFQMLIAELSRRAADGGDAGHRHRAMELLYWLQAGLGTGLRPAEWEFARWHDEAHTQLLLTTGKRKTDHYALPHIADRPIQEEQQRIVFVDPEFRIWVEQHMACVRDHLRSREPFKRYYSKNRIYLWGVCKELFHADTPGFTLYLMRGQFSANRKRRGQPIQNLAAEMGSAVHVVQTSYGAKKHGHHGRGQHDLQHNALRPDHRMPVPAAGLSPSAVSALAARARFSFNEAQVHGGKRLRK